MDERVTFLASFPPIQSAIKITGNGDGMRIQLDIPESEMGNAARLLLWRGVALRVTVEVAPEYEVAHEYDGICGVEYAA